MNILIWAPTAAVTQSCASAGRYAAGQYWFERDYQVQLDSFGAYNKHEDPLVMPAVQLVRMGEHQGVPYFRRRGETGPVKTRYVLVGPGCRVQLYVESASLRNAVREAEQGLTGQRPGEAVRLVNLLVERYRYPPAVRLQARMHRDGLGVTRDVGRAMRILTAAAENGDPEAWAEIAKSHEAAGNEPEAIHAYLQAGHEGSREASARLGLRYLEGRGVPLDPTKAVAWFRAALRGPLLEPGVRTLAGRGLARAYEAGRGLEDDVVNLSWDRNRTSLLNNDALFHFIMGRRHELGLGVRPSRAAAIGHYRNGARDREFGDFSQRALQRLEGGSARGGGPSRVGGGRTAPLVSGTSSPERRG